MFEFEKFWRKTSSRCYRDSPCQFGEGGNRVLGSKKMQSAYALRYYASDGVHGMWTLPESNGGECRYTGMTEESSGRSEVESMNPSVGVTV